MRYNLSKTYTFVCRLVLEGGHAQGLAYTGVTDYTYAIRNMNELSVPV